MTAHHEEASFRRDGPSNFLSSGSRKNVLCFYQQGDMSGPALGPIHSLFVCLSIHRSYFAWYFLLSFRFVARHLVNPERGAWALDDLVLSHRRRTQIRYDVINEVIISHKVLYLEKVQVILKKYKKIYLHYICPSSSHTHVTYVRPIIVRAASPQGSQVSALERSALGGTTLRC